MLISMRFSLILFSKTFKIEFLTRIHTFALLVTLVLLLSCFVNNFLSYTGHINRSAFLCNP